MGAIPFFLFTHTHLLFKMGAKLRYPWLAVGIDNAFWVLSHSGVIQGMGIFWFRAVFLSLSLSLTGYMLFQLSLLLPFRGPGRRIWRQEGEIGTAHYIERVRRRVHSRITFSSSFFFFSFCGVCKSRGVV